MDPRSSSPEPPPRALLGHRAEPRASRYGTASRLQQPGPRPLLDVQGSADHPEKLLGSLQRGLVIGLALKAWTGSPG